MSVINPVLFIRRVFVVMLYAAEAVWGVFCMLSLLCAVGIGHLLGTNQDAPKLRDTPRKRSPEAQRAMEAHNAARAARHKKLWGKE